MDDLSDKRRSAECDLSASEEVLDEAQRDSEVKPEGVLQRGLVSRDDYGVPRVEAFYLQRHSTAGWTALKFGLTCDFWPYLHPLLHKRHTFHRLSQNEQNCLHGL